MKKKSNFIIQGSILAIAGILAKILGMVRRIPMAHIIGDVGNGYYSVAYEVYSYMLIISCYSLPLAVSKVVSAKVSRRQYKNAERAFQCAMIFAVVTGGLGFLVIELFGDYIASHVMLEPMSSLALKVLGPAILMVAIMGVLRGYFQGLGTMMPTAISQIIEQIFVLIVSIAGSYFLYQRGEKVGALLHNEDYAPSYGAAGASLGPVIGAFVGLLFLAFVYMMYRASMRNRVSKDIGGKADSYGQIFRLILLTILPVLLSSTVYNLNNIIDIRIYNDVMIQKGLEDVKAYNWGVYSGKYRVLINVPIALGNAMCSSIVPVLTGLVAQQELRQAKEKINQGLRFTMIIAIPSAVGLAVLARPIITLLFSGEIDLAVNLLQIGSISVVFYCMSTFTNGVLQGINKMQVPVINAVIAFVIHVIFLYATLQMDMGVQAVVYANILFAVVVCILNWIAIRKFLRYRQEVVKTFVKPCIASVIMGVVVLGIYMGLRNIAGNLIIIIAGLVTAVIVYFAALILLRGIDEDDFKRMPAGRTILTVAKKCKLL